jgi:uncharacterized protein YecE (DUF72 family)
MQIQVGTSGYNYPEWRGHFYPEGWPASKMFGYYAERFSTVEINATFYRMPTVKTTTTWRDQAPAGCRYALKAPRRLTHEKRLKDCGDVVPFFLESARVLGTALGPLLFQLPPNLKCDIGRLTEFLSLLAPDLPVAFEFRHDSWLTEQVYTALSDRGAALCVADVGDKATPLVATARHGYFRLRDEGYEPADLARWADAVLGRAGDWDTAFVYFKHEDEGKGPEFARAFREALAARGVTPS